MKTQTFGIVGLGLLGGSLGAALRTAFPKCKVHGYSRSLGKITLARKKKFISSGSVSIEELAAVSNVIFICTPVDTIPSFIRAIDQCAKPGTIVTDVGSTKHEIMRWVSKQSFKNIAFVGSHPMAGSHLTGLEHSKKDLYKNALVFVMHDRGVGRRALGQVKTIWKKLHSRVVELDSERHDQIVAEISQFPHLISALLVNVASENALLSASAGFRDTTRIAQGDPNLWLPIFISNSHEIVRLIRNTQRTLKQLEIALSQNNADFLLKFLQKAAQKRHKINLK